MNTSRIAEIENLLAMYAALGRAYYTEPVVKDLKAELLNLKIKEQIVRIKYDNQKMEELK